MDTATVPDVSKLQCCVINGVTTSAKFLPIDDLIVAPFPTYYLDVCQGFCQKYDSINKRCLDADQTKYTQCIQLTQPKNCIGPALPIAAAGPQLYYGLEATNKNCMITSIC